MKKRRKVLQEGFKGMVPFMGARGWFKEGNNESSEVSIMGQGLTNSNCSVNVENKIKLGSFTCYLLSLTDLDFLLKTMS